MRSKRTSRADLHASPSQFYFQRPASYFVLLRCLSVQFYLVGALHCTGIIMTVLGRVALLSLASPASPHPLLARIPCFPASPASHFLRLPKLFPGKQ